jgi:geranylgeranyl transferase type-2 subunit beta
MYLQQLTQRLAQGIARLPQSERDRHVAYLQKAQNADGGFSGRLGGSDLYYTGFALRSLAVVNALTPEISAKAASFLGHSRQQHASVIDLFSLLYGCLLIQTSGGPDALADSPPDWPERVTTTLETFRTADGGYAKAAGSGSGSTYHSFLVALSYELLGKPLPQPERLAAFVQSRRREDGGYVELAPMKRGGTNPTAAAVGLLQLLDDGTVPAELAQNLSQFFVEMRGEEGGLRANARIPACDLLSTFTGSWTLAQLGTLDRLDPAPVRAYARSLTQPGGGFRGNTWDDCTDVEYTFYGLGVLALFPED